MTLAEIKKAVWGYKSGWKNFDGKTVESKADANQLLNQAARPWSYKNPALEKVDTYQILRDIRDGVVRIEKALDELDGKLGE